MMYTAEEAAKKKKEEGKKRERRIEERKSQHTLTLQGKRNRHLAAATE